jgi:hypothetical protein
MKKLTFLPRLCVALIALSTTLSVVAQNPIWTLPENKAEFGFPPTLPTPSPLPTGTGSDYDGTYSKNPSNAMVNADGELLFFKEGNSIYDKNGSPLGESGFILSISPGMQEFTIVPQPGSCDKYYFFTSENNWNFSEVHYGVIDMSIEDNLYKIVEYESLYDLLPFSYSLRDRPGFAASEERSDGTRLIYFHRGKTQVHKFILDDTDLSYDDSFSVTGANSDPNNYLASEVELYEASNGTYRLASVIMQGTRAHISIAELDSDGDLDSYNTYSIDDAENVTGLEFSPNGEYLYFTVKLSKVLC